MKSRFFPAVLFLTGFVRASNLQDPQTVLSKLLDKIGPDDLPLEEAYFTISDSEAPPKSTLYRFNLTQGQLLDMHARLKPIVSKDCNLQIDGIWRKLWLWCDMNLVGLEAKYYAALSYGARIVQNFTISARIKPHSFGKKPATLVVSMREKSGCNSEKCELYFSGDSVFISAFELDTSTSPRFADFKSSAPRFDKFKEDPRLAGRVWEDFNVKMYTVVLPKVVKAIKDVYNEEIQKRVADVGPLKKEQFRQLKRYF